MVRRFLVLVERKSLYMERSTDVRHIGQGMVDESVGEEGDIGEDIEDIGSFMSYTLDAGGVDSGDEMAMEGSGVRRRTKLAFALPSRSGSLPGLGGCLKFDSFFTGFVDVSGGNLKEDSALPVEQNQYSATIVMRTALRSTASANDGGFLNTALG